MFTKITLKNFRSFDHIEFNLKDKSNTAKNIAIIYGENGSGKSNLMSAFVLLSELLETLNARDAYEEILNQKSIFSDENIDKELKQKLRNTLRDIQAIINDYRMVENNNPIIAEFEFIVNDNPGKYYIELGESEIIKEKLEYLLNKRRGIYFDCSLDNISVNSNLFTDSDLFSDIKASAKRFWGKHSMLAIILHELYDKSESFGWKNISDNFFDLLDSFETLSSHIYIGNRSWNHLSAPIEVLEKPDFGRIIKSDEAQLDIAEEIFSSFFASINSDIEKAYYKKTYNDKYVNYELYFCKRIAGETRNIPFFKESTGNHQLLKILCYILCACLGRTVVFDEADSGIHDVIFQKLILETQPLITGQLIITTHNTMLMEANFAKDTVYILRDEQNGNKAIQCINNYEKRTYSNNNIRNKYLNNEYGGLPKVNPSDLSTLIETFKNRVETNY